MWYFFTFWLDVKIIASLYYIVHVKQRLYQVVLLRSSKRNNMYFVGVDVGTGSVRAALVDDAGRILKKSTNDIKTWNPEADFYQQSSEDIWQSCCKVIRVSET